MRPLPCSAALLALFLSTGALAGEVLPFLHNDYASAVTQAKAQGVPVFVDVWAPW